ncbi:very short patch repair endonuclease [Methylocapsa palsarum]|uniref:Very short patch repair endonuclease n=1 Tax=Methylocapsa palsarum TaxID=1612308 RepID=A0A1I3Y9L3_9HYPH|nr:very short patch repair endonuclease [Methylocapsa palsarum]SFK28554.1 DNA mismatch endonuclease, patch repair protein [Methylocapsa palsarum]
MKPKIIQIPDAIRSATMRAVKSANTKPEMIVRSLAHRLGFRFRLHCKALRGCPDLVFAARRKAIFVNGCFWHGHDCRRGARTPKTNVVYWRTKIANNRRRDAAAQADLAAAGWAVLTVWECETRSLETLRTRLLSFLS